MKEGNKKGPLSTRLRKYRLARGLTQVEVARILQLSSPTSVSRWERGTRLPTATRLLELSALYQRMVNDLLLPQYRHCQKRVLRRLNKLKAKT